MLRIENQAIVFALLCKYTVETEGEKGREVIQKGADMLGWDLDTLMERTILAMRESDAVA